MAFDALLLFILQSDLLLKNQRITNADMKYLFFILSKTLI